MLDIFDTIGKQRLKSQFIFESDILTLLCFKLFYCNFHNEIIGGLIYRFLKLTFLMIYVNIYSFVLLIFSDKLEVLNVDKISNTVLNLPVSRKRIIAQKIS